MAADRKQAAGAQLPDPAAQQHDPGLAVIESA